MKTAAERVSEQWVRALVRRHNAPESRVRNIVRSVVRDAPAAASEERLAVLFHRLDRMIEATTPGVTSATAAARVRRPVTTATIRAIA